MRSVATLVASLGISFTILFDATVTIVCPMLAAHLVSCSPSFAASSPPPCGHSDLWCAVVLLPRALPRPMASSSCTGLMMGTHHAYADEPARTGTITGRFSTALSSPLPQWPRGCPSACLLLARGPCAVRGSLHTRPFNKAFTCGIAQAWASSQLRNGGRRMRKAMS